MGLKRIGLWLAPDRKRTSPHEQIIALVRQVRDSGPDAVLFPEGWLCVDEALHGDAKQIVDDLVRPLTELGIRCFVGSNTVSADRLGCCHSREMLFDAATDNKPYEKHSSAGRIAFQEEGWSGEYYLPLWTDGVAPTICHDMYLSLLGHYHHDTARKLAINPTGGGVLPAKWARVLRGRAMEAGVPVACTMNDLGRGTACWVMGQSGPLTLQSADGERTQMGRRSGTLYLADLSEPIHPANPRLASFAGGVEGLPVTVQDDTLWVGSSRVTWMSEDEICGFHLVCLGDTEMLDPCVWVAPLLASGGRCLYWLRASNEQRAAAVALAEAKAVELCCPVVIESETQPLVVVELYNYSKGVRVNDPPTIQPKFQTGYHSAFKMIRGYEEGGSAWKAHVKQYETLLYSCRNESR